MGAIESSLPAWLRGNPNGTLQRPGADLLGHSPRARRHPLDRDGDDSVHTLFRTERLWPDADFQRRVRNALPGGSPSLAAVARIRWFDGTGYFNFGNRRAAPRYPGKIPAAADVGAANSTCAAGAHSATLSSLAGWVRSTFAGRIVVEERLRRSAGQRSADE